VGDCYVATSSCCSLVTAAHM